MEEVYIKVTCSPFWKDILNALVLGVVEDKLKETLAGLSHMERVDELKLELVNKGELA